MINSFMFMMYCIGLIWELSLVIKQMSARKRNRVPTVNDMSEILNLKGDKNSILFFCTILVLNKIVKTSQVI